MILQRSSVALNRIMVAIKLCWQTGLGTAIYVKCYPVPQLASFRGCYRSHCRVQYQDFRQQRGDRQNDAAGIADLACALPGRSRAIADTFAVSFATLLLLLIIFAS